MDNKPIDAELRADKVLLKHREQAGHAAYREAILKSDIAAEIKAAVEEAKKETWDEAMEFHKAEKEHTEDTAYRRGVEEERSRCSDIVHEAMSVWCAMYAPEECHKKNVRNAVALRDAHGGTLGYIADVESRIRSRPKPGEEKI